jgi:hypothetical protein
MVPIMNQKRGKHFGFICIFYQGNNRVDFEWYMWAVAVLTIDDPNFHVHISASVIWPTQGSEYPTNYSLYINMILSWDNQFMLKICCAICFSPNSKCNRVGKKGTQKNIIYPQFQNRWIRKLYISGILYEKIINF